MGKQAPDGDQIEELGEPSIAGMRELLSTLERPDSTSLQRSLQFEMNKVRETLWKLELKLLTSHMGAAAAESKGRGDWGGGDGEERRPQVDLRDEDWDAELDDSDDGPALVLPSPPPPHFKYPRGTSLTGRLNSSQISSIERNLDYILLRDSALFTCILLDILTTNTCVFALT